ncbi:M1 family metallopeptidase [Ligilactobacillus cholophilus]|uniref:M1 family metallopeptidase n=1 Tax=Ligilactobacillus cholophilus TaxID=3050131 RepID=UPI0025B021AF|nr:M1 family metallopeptidase [Ligilactobacillus cholophilus]
MSQKEHLYDLYRPSHYNIYLDINREKKVFSGKVSIEGEALDSNIGINEKYMNITSVSVNGKDAAFIYDKDNEAIRIEVDQLGSATLEIEFNAKLTDTMMGIYPSYYEVDGIKKQIIGTQFESTAARQAFPCVDEPEAKATFDMAIKFDEKPGETILANMPERECVEGVHYFETTKKMSSYLIAFAFGEMVSKKTTTSDGIKIGVFASPAHQEDELDFALDIAKNAIEFYEKYYDTKYPLPHSWQLGLPDFSAGAMENWGLITYREAFLTLDPNNAALSIKQHNATDITHELAHQWFGDLVTMKWWDDLWLNESFANMMEYVSSDAIHPEWHMWEVFQEKEVPMALNRDAIDGVQPVHVEVEDPADIDAIFVGAIVYAKGSRMLVMVRSLIGDDALRKGLKNYFEAHKYGNAVGEDLWKALGDASGIDVSAVMKSWLNQPGYPVVTAKIVDGNLQLSQKQFFIGEGKDMGRKWQIPLNSNYETIPELMKDTTLDLGNYQELKQKNNNKPFILNVDNNSHFIVKYDETLLNDILEHLDELDAISQRELLQDMHLLAKGREISYSALIPLMGHFKDNQSYIVNDALFEIADDLKKFVTPDSQDEKNLRALFNQLSESKFAKLGIKATSKDDNDAILGRPTIVKAALYGKNEKAIEAAHKLFTEYQDNIINIPASVRAAVMMSEVTNYGNEKLYEKLLNEYRQTSDGIYQRDLSVALTATTDKQFIQKLLQEFKNADTIKPQDLREWYLGLLQNDDGQQAAWDWMRDNWNWMNETVGGDMEFHTYITVTANTFDTEKRYKEFKAFFEPKLNTPGLTREIEMDVKVIKGKVDLINAEKQAVNKGISEAL